MAMDEGASRPEESREESPAETQDWYFDLPSGAWERQEEKNRQLRERVHSNLAEESPRPDPFVLARREPEAKPRGGLFGLGKKKQPAKPEEPKQTLFGTFELHPGAGDEDADADEWSTEPDVPLRPRLFTGASQTPSEEPRAAERPADSAVDDAGEEDTLAAMKSWAERGREKPSLKAFTLQPQGDGVEHDDALQEAPEVAAEEPENDLGFDATPRANWSWSDHSQPAANTWPGQSANEHEAAAVPDASWLEPDASGGSPRDEVAQGADVEQSTTDPADVTPPATDASEPELPVFDKVPLRPVRQPEPERETQSPSDVEGASTPSKWDEMFEGAQEVSNIEAMREWLSKPVFAEPDDSPKEIPPELLQPFDWEKEDEPNDSPTPAEELSHRFAWKVGEGADESPEDALVEGEAPGETPTETPVEAAIFELDAGPISGDTVAGATVAAIVIAAGAKL